jgi:hypothetical protein
VGPFCGVDPRAVSPRLRTRHDPPRCADPDFGPRTRRARQPNDQPRHRFYGAGAALSRARRAHAGWGDVAGQPGAPGLRAVPIGQDAVRKAQLPRESARPQRDPVLPAARPTNLEEMLPVIYTPTIGEAIERFSHDLQPPAVASSCRSTGRRMIEESLLDYGLPSADDVDLVVRHRLRGHPRHRRPGHRRHRDRDRQAVSVYTAAAGMHPRRVRSRSSSTWARTTSACSAVTCIWASATARVRGERYDEFVDHVRRRRSSRLFPQAR